MNFDYESIRSRIANALLNPLNKIEGSFCMDNIQAVAQELAQVIAMQIDPIIDRVSVDTAEGEFLDKKALDFGEVRLDAQQASGYLQFTGIENTYIPAATQTESEDTTYMTTDDGTIDSSGTCVIPAVCVQSGIIGNTPAHTINKLVYVINGVYAVDNPAAFAGGTDEETDEAFRSRILQKIQQPISSGNEAHYVYWAQQVPGVAAARCKGCWNGPGTVKVVLLGNDVTIPDDDIIQSTADYIAQNRPVGANVTVAAAVPLEINITAAVILAAGYAVETVKNNIQNNIVSYFKSIAFDDTTEYISYHKIGDLIFTASGVADIESYTVNGGNNAIPITYDRFPVLQGCVLNGS